MHNTKVGKDVLFDYMGMNPATARIFGFGPIDADEILVRDDLSDQETSTTIEHEEREMNLINGGMEYWPAHIQALVEEKQTAPVEAKSMPEQMRKSFVFEVKELENRVLEFTGSTENVDRDGEVIKADGWVLTNYKKNPVVLFGHDYQSLPVAKCIKAWTEGGKLKFRDQFPTAEEYPFADTVYKLCKGGYLNTVSVGFIPLDSEQGKGDVRKVWTKQELLEHSIVPVPSNPDALVSARTAGVISVKEFKDIENVSKTKVSQGLIKDEIDYLLSLIKQVGLNDENRALLKTVDFDSALEDQSLRLAAGDMMNVLCDCLWQNIRGGGTGEEKAKAIEKTVNAFRKAFMDWTSRALASGLLDEHVMPESLDAVFLGFKSFVARVAGSDIPVDIKASIRNSLSPVIKALGDHDEAHQKCFKMCKDALEDICQSEPDDKADKAEIIKQIIDEYRRLKK